MVPAAPSASERKAKEEIKALKAELARERSRRFSPPNSPSSKHNRKAEDEAGWNSLKAEGSIQETSKLYSIASELVLSRRVRVERPLINCRCQRGTDLSFRPPLLGALRSRTLPRKRASFKLWSSVVTTIEPPWGNTLAGPPFVCQTLQS